MIRHPLTEATAAADLAAHGVKIGACVRNKDGLLFRLTTIKPRVYNFDAALSFYGVRFRADGTWGTHEHWVGFAAYFTVEL